MSYTPTIGMEVHIELSTASKMFCRCSANHFGKKANTQVCPICLGLPGSLPFANTKAIEATIKLGLALNCQIASFSKFDRKHYFYPDLPKGYQISQYDNPLCFNGKFVASGHPIRIKRVHLEEDTGKLIHKRLGSEEVSLVDFNRSGVPLLELVTEPDFQSIKEVLEFVKEIQGIVRYLEISDAEMQKGSMRLEANISLKKDKKLPNYKVELKNINSFRFLKKALEVEIKRQTQEMQKGEKLIQETRGYDEERNITFSQRAKESSADYRYFPEPDLPPIVIFKSQVSALKSCLPELPEQKRIRFKKEFQLSDNYINILTQERSRADFFEEALKLVKKYKIQYSVVASSLVNQNLDKKFNQPMELIKNIVQTTKLKHVTRDEVKKAVVKVIKDNPNALKDYQAGKVEVIGFLIGQTQKNLKGKGDPQLIRKILLKKLNES